MSRLLLEELFYGIESVPTWNPTLTECKTVQPIDEFTDISYQVGEGEWSRGSVGSGRRSLEGRVECGEKVDGCEIYLRLPYSQSSCLLPYFGSTPEFRVFQEIAQHFGALFKNAPEHLRV